MALENKHQKAKRIAMEALSNIVAATQAGTFVYVAQEIYIPLIKEGLAEVNETMVNPNNVAELACRATQKGVEKVMSETVNETPAEATAAPLFVIEDSPVFEKTEKKRGGFVKGSKYPYEQLEVGKGFFIPGKTAKAMQSLVANAQMKFAVPQVDEEGKAVTRTTKPRKEGAAPKEVPAVTLVRKFEVNDYTKDGVAGCWFSRKQ